MKIESENCTVIFDSLPPRGLYCPWNSPGQNAGVGNLSLLQEIFPTQGLNPRLPHCRQILYQVSHKRKSKNNKYYNVERASLIGQLVKNPPAMQEILV